MFENATEGIFRTTPEGRLLAANPALARMLGYASAEEIVAAVTDVGRQLYVNPEQRAAFKQTLESTGVVRNFEEENYRKDGTKIWVSLNAHVVRDSKGAVVCYEGTNQDITARKWAEALLQTQSDFGTFLSSTDDLRAAVERLLKVALHNEGIDSGAVHLVDPGTGRLELTAHEGLSAEFGARAAQSATDSARPGLLAPAAEGGSMSRIVGELKQEGLRCMEVIPIHHSGQVVAVLSLGSHTVDEFPLLSRQAVEAVVYQAGGAIARIRAEQSLRANRELLAKTFQSIRAAVFILDAETGVIKECNPAATQIFGYRPEELVGQTLASLHLDARVLEEFRGLARATFEVQGFLDEVEFPMKRKNASLFPTAHTVMPIRDEAGRVRNWVNVIRDITERKKAEEELRLLPRRIIEAQEAERFRIARELHDSVNQLIASAKMRLLKVEKEVAAFSPATREVLARCGHLLVQALEENRRIAHDLRPSDLDEFGLTIACRNFCRQFRSRTNLAVRCNISRFGWRLPAAHELQLFRIIQEAFNNVEKHARASEIRLTISCRDNCIRLRIRDNGRGFDLESARAPKNKKRGIGLTNIRERAASVGGICEIESRARQGTILTVSVPLKPKE